MKKIITLILIALLGMNTGCASYMAHRSWSQAQQEKAVQVTADGEMVKVGVDLTAGEYLADNWLVAIGAGIVDGLLLYGAYEGVQEINDNSSSDDDIAGGSGNTVVINGNGNDVNVDNDSNQDGTGNTGSF